MRRACGVGCGECAGRGKSSIMPRRSLSPSLLGTVALLPEPSASTVWRAAAPAKHARRSDRPRIAERGYDSLTLTINILRALLLRAMAPCGSAVSAGHRKNVGGGKGAEGAAALLVAREWRKRKKVAWRIRVRVRDRAMRRGGMDAREAKRREREGQGVTCAARDRRVPSLQLEPFPPFINHLRRRRWMPSRPGRAMPAQSRCHRRRLQRLRRLP